MTVWVLLPSLQFDADVRHAWQYFALHVVANGDVQRVVLIELHERDGEVVLVIVGKRLALKLLINPLLQLEYQPLWMQ